MPARNVGRVTVEWAEVGEALGSAIVAVEQAPWGSKNRTHILTLADGRRVVWQQYADRNGALARATALAMFSQPGVHLPVEVPTLLAADFDADRPWAVLRELPGEVVYVTAGHDLSAPMFPRIAVEMGNTLAAIQRLDTDGFSLPDLWARPTQLGLAAEAWLNPLASHLGERERREVQRVIADIPALFDARPVVVSHGDFGPQNVLIHAGRVSGLLDYEDARLADPLLDVVWWAWIVRAHTPEAFPRSWPGFLSAARIDATEPGFRARATALIICRLLETAEYFRLNQPEKFLSWADRIGTTLAWPADALLLPGQPADRRRER